MTHETRFHVGLVFQYPEYQLFEETVYKDIAFGPGNMGLGAEEIDRRVREAAGFVGIGEELLQQSPFELSGGQKRRVAIAGVLAMEPEVLILDEPTAGLDPAGCESILAEIRQYHRAKNNTILLVSHSMEEIARNAQRIVVLDERHIVMDGTPREIFFPGAGTGSHRPGCAGGHKDRRCAAAARHPGGRLRLYHRGLERAAAKAERGRGRMLKDITLDSISPAAPWPTGWTRAPS